MGEGEGLADDKRKVETFFSPARNVLVCTLHIQTHTTQTAGD